MDLYAENILDHYRHPRNKNSEFVMRNSPARTTERSGGECISHTEENLSCGDSLTIRLQIEGNRIEGISWDGTGCAISQAAMSMLSEKLSDMTIGEAENLSPKHLYELLGVPIGLRREKCALLALHACKNALHAHRKEPLQGWLETVGTNDRKR